MTAQERLAAFKAALAQASAQFGVQLAVVQSVGNLVLDEPALGYVLLDEAPALTNLVSAESGEESHGGE